MEEQSAKTNHHEERRTRNENHKIFDMETAKSPPLVATLGMFILDSFKYTSDYCKTSKPTLDPDEWYVGGGGTYAAVGARIWVPPDRIVMIVHKGLDFPSKITEELESYSPSLFTFISDPSHPRTTRAVNTYSNDRRDFAYLTEKRQIKLEEIYFAKSKRPDFIHLICSPVRLLNIQQECEENFKQSTSWNPRWIWEPVPDSCKEENLSTVIRTAKMIAIFSPNELEASELLGHPKPLNSRLEVQAIGDYFHQVVGFPLVVIRSGKLGAYVVGSFPQSSSSNLIEKFWVPPLIEDQTQVIDQTGAGNAFLGGLMAGLASGETLLDAACFGSVSSGLTITQLGLPKIDNSQPDNPSLELWNHGLCPRLLAAQLRQKIILLPTIETS